MAGGQAQMRRPTSKALRFTRLHLRNWRNFLRVKLELSQRVFLAGPNAAGTSNLLDAFRFLHELASPGCGFQAAVARRGGVRRMRCLAARQFSDLSLVALIGSDADPAEWEYEVHFNQEDTPRPLIKRERIAHRGEELAARPDAEDEADAERLQLSALELGGANRQLRELTGFLHSVRYLHPLPQLIREPGTAGGGRDDPHDRDFLERAASAPEQTRKARLRLILEALQTAVPKLEQLEMRREARGRVHLRARFEHWRARGAWQTEEEFSDGTLRLMAVLWGVLEGPGPLLIEEPELSLHAGVVRRIPDMLRQLQKRSGRQVIAATHSGELLREDAVDLEEMVLLMPAGEATAVRPPVDQWEVRHFLEEIAAQQEPPAEAADQLALFEGQASE